MNCKLMNVLITSVCVCLMTLSTGQPTYADGNQTTASGTGAFLPRATGDGGDYFGPGVDPENGNVIYFGSLDLVPIQPLKFRFQNTGRGTDEEVFHEVFYEDGSALFSRFKGVVELDPQLDKDGNPTGLFTAEWNGTWVATGGTGRFRNARGSFRVTAINEPFALTDFAWKFSWSWTGNIAVPNNHDKANVMTLSTEGNGDFAPANLGIGDPAAFPFVIGDGSGAGVYDGTPVGEASLDGMSIGPDQHWGTAQSIRPGLLSPAFTIWYPGVTGENPRDDAGGQLIHIMATELGEIWFNYKHYFELDDMAGVIIGRAAFHVVGGTGMFKGAKGTVYVRVDSNLSDVTGLPPDKGPVVAPFVYDFKGFIELAN